MSHVRTRRGDEGKALQEIERRELDARLGSAASERSHEVDDNDNDDSDDGDGDGDVRGGGGIGGGGDGGGGNAKNSQYPSGSSMSLFIAPAPQLQPPPPPRRQSHPPPADGGANANTSLLLAPPLPPSQDVDVQPPPPPPEDYLPPLPPPLPPPPPRRKVAVVAKEVDIEMLVQSYDDRDHEAREDVDIDVYQATLAASFGIVHYDWFVRIERRAEEMREAREAERVAGMARDDAGQLTRHEAKKEGARAKKTGREARVEP